MAVRSTISVVLPAYNEEATLERTVETTQNALDVFADPSEYEIIISEDGCTDRTPEIADELAETTETVRHHHSDERLGRGGALAQSFDCAEGDVLVYFDTDLATDMRHLEELVESVRSEGYDVATGSRWLPGSDASRSAERKGASWFFNRLVRAALGSEVADHQCGFKAFDADALAEILPAVENTHWFWDTEVLVRAQHRGFEVKEFPVNWEPKADTKVNLLGDSVRMSGEIARLWFQLSVEQRLPAKRIRPSHS